MNIAIAGDLGSGKSTVTKVLAARGWEVVSAGEAFRREANRRGLTLRELTSLCRADPTVDHAIDQRVMELGELHDRAVFDSRLAFHLVPGALKVYLTCPDEVAAIRVMYAGRTSESFATLDEAMRSLAWRRDEERSRFLRMYGVDIRDTGNFDIVIDATKTPEEIADLIEGAVACREAELREGDPTR